MGARTVRGGLGEIAAQADEDLRLAGEHRGDRLDGVVPVVAWHFEAEAPFQCVEQRRRRPLVDAHGAVTLNVAVAADRAETGARAAQVAAQELQVDDFLDDRHRMVVLGDAHRPADDDPVRPPVHPRSLLDFRQAQPGLALQVFPGVASSSAR